MTRGRTGEMFVGSGSKDDIRQTQPDPDDRPGQDRQCKIVVQSEIYSHQRYPLCSHRRLTESLRDCPSQPHHHGCEPKPQARMTIKHAPSPCTPIPPETDANHHPGEGGC